MNGPSVALTKNKRKKWAKLTDGLLWRHEGHYRNLVLQKGKSFGAKATILKVLDSQEDFEGAKNAFN